MPRWSAAAATARPSGSRAPRAPGGEGREPSAMATARAGGEAEQPPPLRVATTLGEGGGGEWAGAGPEHRPSPAQAPSSTGRRPAPPPEGQARAGAAGSRSLNTCTPLFSLSLSLFFSFLAVGGAGRVFFKLRKRANPSFNLVLSPFRSVPIKDADQHCCYINPLQYICFWEFIHYPFCILLTNPNYVLLLK